MTDISPIEPKKHTITFLPDEKRERRAFIKTMEAEGVPYATSKTSTGGTLVTYFAIDADLAHIADAVNENTKEAYMAPTERDVAKDAIIDLMSGADDDETRAYAAVDALAELWSKDLEE